jgi:hypothetical protein
MSCSASVPSIALAIIQVGFCLSGLVDVESVQVGFCLSGLVDVESERDACIKRQGHLALPFSGLNICYVWHEFQP